ncbi:5-(carboxyamino)imidazole ribonucleotide mutase [Blattabacterium cuenoti]|uniref:5-(carboxyamino)imidazole ribonucleotide mutase n=1 Tax=Blattabacterium cuenoti TaxID=1653831 RepID=UPI00163CAFED|nr:5-(carboxyamino)imidazole ribonucleotide mutase [Blattabacterium cuenoti]
MKVAIFLGSISDKSIMKNAIEVLNIFRITYKCYIISAHRLPDILSDTIIKIENEKTEVIIAGAGLSAHLPGIISSKTIIPVIGVPIFNPSSINNFLGGIDALSSITQMPNGVPIAAVGINNSYNAALLSVHMLSIKYIDLKKSLKKFRYYNRKKLKNKIEQNL